MTVNLNAYEKIQINILFQYQLKKELDNGKTITYKLKFTDSFRFISSTLSKKDESVYDFIGLKNNKLHHKYNKCKK